MPSNQTSEEVGVKTKIDKLGLTKYTDAFGIPRRLAKPFISDVLKWISNNGIEWTVTRLKGMKLALVREKAGMPSCSSWVAIKGNRFKGAFGAIQRWSHGSEKKWTQSIQLLNCYTVFVAGSVTPIQEQKFLSGVNAEPTPIPESISTGVIEAIRTLRIKVRKLPDPSPLVLMNTSELKRAPHPNGKTYPESEVILESLAYTRQTRIGWDYRSRYPRLFDAVEAGIEFNDPRDADLVDYPNSIGKIGLIQEPGFKLRAVANPGRIYQAALKPLGDALYNLLPSLPWDCTHNQSKPFDVIQDQLHKGLPTFSVDLSDATSHFPLSLQMEALKTIFGDCDDVRLFGDLSRAPWFYVNDFISWKRGQPLGLYPSFAAFALTHGLLLYYLNGNRHNNMFFVLGDDVVILDSDLHDLYRITLEILGCPVSVAKSLSSNDMAEFGGKLLTPNRVIPQTKWRQVSDDSFIDIVRNIGPRAVGLLRNRQREVVKLLWTVPDFMGGLGFNPEGIPLQDRCYLAYSIFGDKRPSPSYLMSYNRKIAAMNYYDSTKFQPPTDFQLVEGDFDQKSIAYILKFLPQLLYWYEISGANLFDISDSLPLCIDGQVSRITTLERFERILT